jgi:hypothetical protein
MWSWAIGQAGFGEQIQAYGDTFWRQVGSPLLWSLVALWTVLALVAIVLFVYAKRSGQRETVAAERPGAAARVAGAAKHGGAQAA